MKKVVELKDDGYCFACGPLNPLGLRLSFDKIDKRVITKFVPQKEHQGYAEIVHGGIISTILDEAMVKASILNGIDAVTAEITVRFRRPLFIGTPCIVEAWINSQTSRLIETESLIKDEKENIIATARAKLIPSI